MAARSITKFLTAPSKVANALDWRKASGSILSMSVSGGKIDLAVASHPSFQDPIHQLPSIPLKTEVVNNRKVLQQSVIDELTKVVQDYQVCGMVVNWPVQKEGWCGAQCGRVLNALDQLAARSKTLLNAGRPICLWDEEHHAPLEEDEWGRTPIYSKVSDRTFHQASQEQYNNGQHLALDVWNDFFRTHWPDLYNKQQLGDSLAIPDEPDQQEQAPASRTNIAWLNYSNQKSHQLKEAYL